MPVQQRSQKLPRIRRVNPHHLFRRALGDDLPAPVATLWPHVDEVVGRVNASPNGLGGSVWSSDTDRAIAIAERIETGTIWVNQHLAIGPHIPMAGFRQSGLGVEQSVEGLEEFTQLQVLNAAR